MNLIINKIDYIKCVFNINKENVGKEIQILNHLYYCEKEIIKNDEIEKKIKMIINGEIRKCIFKYKFNKEGKYNIYYIQENELENMSYMFNQCKYLEEINLSSFDTNNVTNMKNMFSGCSSLKEINLSSFNTNNVNNMRGMFSRCSSLKEINLSSFNTNNVTNMRNIFDGISSSCKLSCNDNNLNNLFNKISKCIIF